MDLFHVSEESEIERFEPRPPPSPDSGISYPAVFAIGDNLLHNYLLPRDCPRVTFYAGPETSEADRQRFHFSAQHVVAVESSWLARIRATMLYCYRLPLDTFTCIDEVASYYASRSAVIPLSVWQVDDVLKALLDRDVELRFVKSLWPLHDAVAASSLQFSMIRMRNAAPRE